MRWGVLLTAIGLVAVGVLLAMTSLVQLGAPYDIEARMFGLVVGLGGIGLAIYALLARGERRQEEPAPDAHAPPEPPVT